MASNYRSCPYPAQHMQRRSRPDSLPAAQTRRPHQPKVRSNLKTYSGSQYGAHTTPHREELTRAGDYVILKGQIADDLYHALNVFENKRYIIKVVHKRDCFKLISHYKNICPSTELPHIHDVVTVDNATLLVLDLHPYFDRLPAQADQEKVQKYTKEILELVSKLHESSISPQKMSMNDFTCYKDTPTSIGYHLQMMKLDGSLMLNDYDEEMSEVDSYSSPELVKILDQKKNANTPDSSDSDSHVSRSKLDAIHNGLDLEKADSWRVGAMVYTMLAGRSPFPDPVSDTQPFFEAVYSSQLKPPTKKTTRNAWEFLLGLLEPDPEERLSISQALEHPWLQEYALRTESHCMVSSKEEHKLPSSNPSSPVL